MKDFSKYKGIFPAFYACYDENGKVSPERVRAFTEYLIEKKVNGVYVGGSSGECIYQSVEERKEPPVFPLPLNCMVYEFGFHCA